MSVQYTSSVDLTIAVVSKPGGRPQNEDACGYWSSNTAFCFVVSDGLGGYHGGQIASQQVVSSVLKHFAGNPDISPRNLSDLLADANQALIERKRVEPMLAEMRATAVILAIDFARGQANWAHLGDSRLYCFRQGRIAFRTADHSYLQNMVNLGHLDRSELRNHPMGNLLLGALGGMEEFTPTIQEQAIALQAGDAFLLCTDGFWQAVNETEMLNGLAGASSVNEWLSTMETALLARVKQGHDNYSAIGIWLHSPEVAALSRGRAAGTSGSSNGQDDEPPLSSAWATRTLPLG